MDETIEDDVQVEEKEEIISQEPVKEQLKSRKILFQKNSHPN